MNIWVSVLLFAVGIALVIKGGDWFVDAASWIARAAGLPSFIIGATIVSIATTMPEMIVSMMAAAQGKIDMAIGNAVGSVTANTGLIMALSLLFLPIIIKRRQYINQCVILIGCAALMILGSMHGSLTTWASIMLLILFAVFMVLNVRNGKSEMQTSEKAEITKKDLTKNIILFVVGAAAIVGGSQLLINGGSAIAEFFKVPERIIAVTMVAIGTSLPELVTTITAIRKKETNLSIGNIVGANIIDLSLILPLCSVVSGKNIPVPAQSFSIDMPVCLGVILIALVPLLIREKGSKIQGGLLLAAYIGYLAFTL
jgi:cation:H+ antiporter